MLKDLNGKLSLNDASISIHNDSKENNEDDALSYKLRKGTDVENRVDINGKESKIIDDNSVFF